MEFSTISKNNNDAWILQAGYTMQARVRNKINIQGKTFIPPILPSILIIHKATRQNPTTKIFKSDLSSWTSQQWKWRLQYIIIFHEQYLLPANNMHAKFCLSSLGSCLPSNRTLPMFVNSLEDFVWGHWSVYYSTEKISEGCLLYVCKLWHPPLHHQNFQMRSSHICSIVQEKIEE